MNVLTVPLLPRLKVSNRIVKWHIVYEFDLIPDMYGLDWIGLGQQKMDPCPTLDCTAAAAAAAAAGGATSVSATSVAAVAVAVHPRPDLSAKVRPGDDRSVASTPSTMPTSVLDEVCARKATPSMRPLTLSSLGDRPRHSPSSRTRSYSSLYKFTQTVCIHWV